MNIQTLAFLAKGYCEFWNTLPSCLPDALALVTVNLHAKSCHPELCGEKAAAA